MVMTTDQQIKPPIGQCLHGKATFALWLLGQILLFTLCLGITIAVKDFLTVNNFFAEYLHYHATLPLFLRLVVSVLLLMPLYLISQVLYFHLSASEAEKKHGPRNFLLFDYLAIPVMVYFFVILLLEALLNLCRGVSFADMKKQFPGWEVFGDWVFANAELRIPHLPVPTSAIIFSLAFAWFILVVQGALSSSSEVFKGCLAFGTIFGSFVGMTIAFSSRSWEKRMMPASFTEKL